MNIPYTIIDTLVKNPFIVVYHDIYKDIYAKYPSISPLTSIESIEGQLINKALVIVIG